MPSNVEQLSPSRVKFTVEIPFSDLKSHLDKAYQTIAQQVNIPGFRRGKVPASVIDQRYGRGAVLQEAINAALPTAYNAAVQEAKVYPLADPEIEVTKLEDGQLVEFTAEVDVRPDFALPAFDAISVSVPNATPTDDLVAERIELLRRRFATSVEVERAAQDGDVVTIDLVASRDGEPIEDGTAEGVSYAIGSGTMLEGLDDAVTGLSAGDNATFASTLVGGALEGEPADIAITVTKVAEQTLPELDDAFAQMVSEFDTVDEMKADLAKAAADVARYQQLEAAQESVLETVVTQADFEVPAGLLAAQVAGRKENIEGQLANAGLTIDRYLEQSAEEKAQTPEEFWANVEAETTKQLKAQLVLDKVADDAELGVDQQELIELIGRKAQANNSTPEAEMQHMMDHGHMSEWMQEVRRSKALASILSQVTFVDADGNTVELTAPVTAE
ncbi:MAG: trigger factor [Propionibacteriaceae bacterium]|nr:trigger factor [Micropruina sp.]